ncbi:hypothetical protein OCU04_002706 [Sclerotinia nivalis]|uniref:Uncharacterized protein n=1 Tax=Sclerotinia nivalis TaxID=352851 RepID=A0A9X0DPC9_9HELO|nr:hypothetical protein OCU04_002706 [Sclerotinia nivalis]
MPSISITVLVKGASSPLYLLNPASPLLLPHPLCFLAVRNISSPDGNTQKLLEKLSPSHCPFGVTVPALDSARIWVLISSEVGYTDGEVVFRFHVLWLYTCADHIHSIDQSETAQRDYTILGSSGFEFPAASDEAWTSSLKQLCYVMISRLEISLEAQAIGMIADLSGIGQTERNIITIAHKSQQVLCKVNETC